MPKQNIQISFGRDIRRDVHGDAAESRLHMKGEKSMSKETRQFFEQLKSGEPPTLVESIKEAASLLKDVGGKLYDEFKPMFDHGRTELAAALFSSHDAHVMYMRPENGVEQGQDQTNEMAEDQRDLQREM